LSFFFFLSFLYKAPIAYTHLPLFLSSSLLVLSLKIEHEYDLTKSIVSLPIWLLVSRLIWCSLRNTSNFILVNIETQWFLIVFFRVLWK
jgi:hypothetical protein